MLIILFLKVEVVQEVVVVDKDGVGVVIEVVLEEAGEEGIVVVFKEDVEEGIAVVIREEVVVLVEIEVALPEEVVFMEEVEAEEGAVLPLISGLRILIPLAPTKTHILSNSKIFLLIRLAGKLFLKNKRMWKYKSTLVT